MKVKSYVMMMIVGGMLYSCAPETKTLGIGIKSENRNDSIRPGDDFYESLMVTG